MRWAVVVACIEAVLCFRGASLHGALHGEAALRSVQQPRWPQKSHSSVWPCASTHCVARRSPWRRSTVRAKTKSEDPPPAFVRLVHVKAVRQQQLLGARIAATEGECKAIAKRAEVFAVHRFQANVTLTRVDEPMIKVAGTLTATFTADKDAPISTVNTAFTVAALDKTVGSDVDMLSMDNPYMFESNKEGKLDLADICYNFFVLNMQDGD